MFKKIGFAFLLASTLVFIPVGRVVAQNVMLPDFSQLVEQVGPSVVNIRTTEKIKVTAPGTNFSDDQMLEFFRRFGLPMPPGFAPSPIPRAKPGRPAPAPQEEERPRGLGSGFVLTDDGFIMTNAHVVAGADEVIVTLTDKREFKAKIIGVDKRTDVAVVKIDATGLPVVKIGDVSRLKVGEWVMAIGSPFGLDNTVTAGIVSAKQRDTGEYLPFIQTDVAINPGNSGGPLINLRGEVVGINSQIYSQSGGFQGISFAIPIDEASRVAEQLRATGRVIRGRIGVQIDQVNKELAESIGLGKAQGALIRGVESGSPADKAGIEAGDVITQFDGKTINKSSDLPHVVGESKPGKIASVTVFRRGVFKVLSVTVAEVEADKPVARASTEPTKSHLTLTVQALGLTVTELDAAKRKELKIKGGVRVDAAAGPAAKAGLREGDVIVSVANTEVASLKEFETVLRKLDKNKTVNVLVRRGDLSDFALIRPQR